MLPAITSVRFDSSAGIWLSHGIHSCLMVFTPIQSSTALLISQSIPVGFLLSSSHASGGFTENPSVTPLLTAFAYEGSPQLSNMGFDSLKNSCALASGAARSAQASPT